MTNEREIRYRLRNVAADSTQDGVGLSHERIRRIARFFEARVCFDDYVVYELRVRLDTVQPLLRALFQELQ